MPIKLKQVGFSIDGEPLDDEARATIKETTEALGFGPEALVAIAKAMPPTMNGAGLITVIINMMANYDMLPRSFLIIIELTRALADLKLEKPEFFEEGGIERSREEAEKKLGLGGGTFH